MVKANKTVLLESKILQAADKIFKVAVYGHDNFKAALVTHYAYSKDRKLRKQAHEFIKDLLVGYLSEEEIHDLVAEDAIQYLFQLDDIPFPKPALEHFTFIDLFAGIGGFRMAMQRQGGRCVFTSEWDKEAQKTYYANYGEIPIKKLGRSKNSRINATKKS